jgi:poly(beta-D-mannuronate) C5 epimerase
MCRPWVALFAVLYSTAPSWAGPDVGLQDEVRAALEKPDGEAVLALADRLAGGIAVPPVPAAPANRDGGAVEVRAGQIQAALTQLSILAGGNGHLALQLAQASRTDVIDVISGTATLADISAIQGLAPGPAEVWRLTRPLVVWPGATLVLSPGEVLELDTSAGAFILSFGEIRLTGATLRGDVGKNDRFPSFRPFLLVTGQGAFRAERSNFADLGFRGPVAFRGVSILTGGLLRPAIPTVVIASRFDRVFSLSFEGADRMVLTENRISEAGAAAISVKGGAEMVIAGNRIIGTTDGAGMRLSGALRKVAILGNLIRDGGRNGLQVDGSARGMVLRGNVVAGNAEAGISIRNASCVALQGNVMTGNGTSGLRLLRSGQVRIAGNVVLSNGAAGVEIQAQRGLGQVLLSDNLVARNREGLRAAELGEVRLTGNDLADQIPRQFAGDFGPWLGAYLSAGTDLVIPAAASDADVAAAPCGLE